MKKQEDISLARIVAKWLREHGVDAVLENHHSGYDRGREPTVHIILAGGSDDYGVDELPTLMLNIAGTKIWVTPKFKEHAWDNRDEVDVTHPESFQQLKSIIDKFKEEYNDTAAAG